MTATKYAYDQAGRLTSVERAKAGEVPAIEESYGYDGTGLRSSQTVSGVTSDLVWDQTAGLPLLLSDEQASYIYGPGGLPVAQISSAEVPSYYHHDQLGSTRMLTSASGAVTATFSYSAYGVLTGKTGTATAPLGYAGQYTNAQSGLQYLRARVYDPATGQFLTRDPITEVTREPYSYAGNNPANFSDPTGLFLREAATAFVGGMDELTLGLTKEARDFVGIGEGGLELCGPLYEGGGKVGAVASWILPTPFRWGRVASWMARAAAGGRGAARVEITFGHGARHMASKGLDPIEVEAAIRAQVASQVSNAAVGGPFWGRVIVDGQRVLYKGYGLPDGRIEVGTYFVR